ncbi:MAG: energy transducer TonB [Bacteroidia bacterium]
MNNKNSGSMYKTIFILFIVSLTSVSQAQTVSVKYFNNKYLEKEVAQEKAKFSQSITVYGDGKTTIEIKNIKKNQVVRSETKRGEEPFGIWINEGSGELDYNFELDYRDTACQAGISDVRIEDYFEDNDTFGYKAPKILTGEKSVMQFLMNRIAYPVYARENEITGKVILTFTLTKDGNIERIAVKQGAHVTLTKEAVRVIRQLKFSSGPKLKGQDESFCVILPVSFRLQ